MSAPTAGGADLSVGARNALTDVAGLRVGHHDRRDGGYLTGTTVVLAPDGGMAAGVDVRGGGPGTRETDLLHPTATVERIHAVTLTGGSAYGLAAASGVADVEALTQAIENAGSVDPQKVRDALAKLNFESLYGRIAFAENGQIDLPQIVIQVQGNDVVPIFGVKGMINQPKYPMPAWNAR